MSVLLLAAVVLLIFAVASQVLLLRIGEGRIERRLSEFGGDAFVVLEAFPATRLLRRHGERISVSGRRLAIGMSREGGGLSALDGFAEVEIVLSDFTTGPFRISSFELCRSGGGPYLMRAEAITTGAELVDFGGETLGVTGSSLLAALAKQAPLGGRSFPVAVEVELESEQGLLTIASGGGTIAGYPAGRIASAIAVAVARRLEISF